MASQLDLDQGGTQRSWVKSYLGPSVGWVWFPEQNVLPLTTTGTTTLNPSVSLVTVNVAGLVTIKLPAATNPTVAAGAQPGLFVDNPITIVDIGGNAGSNTITIQPAAGETIMGLSSITITVNYGGYVLAPNSAQQTWNSISP
jgi:hypothetical protein